MQPELARIRRDLHRFPETGWLEMRTTAILAKALRAMGYETYTGRAVCKEGARLGLPDEAALAAHAERALAQGAPEDELTQDVRAGYTGVVAVLRCGEGATLAMRFDIDALPMAECPQETHRPTREGFASVNPGMMHACGHDGHAAIGLGVAHILAAHRDALHGTVKLIFQPAEEGVRGAYAIVENGWLDDVDVLLASHIAPTGQADDGDVTVGTWGSLATTKYDAVFTGRAAHAGGFPEQGKNALLAAASAALALHAIPRHSGGRSFVNVGTARGLGAKRLAGLRADAGGGARRNDGDQPVYDGTDGGNLPGRGGDAGLCVQPDRDGHGGRTAQRFGADRAHRRGYPPRSAGADAFHRAERQKLGERRCFRDDEPGAGARRAGGVYARHGRYGGGAAHGHV